MKPIIETEWNVGDVDVNSPPTQGVFGSCGGNNWPINPCLRCGVRERDSAHAFCPHCRRELGM